MSYHIASNTKARYAGLSTTLKIFQMEKSAKSDIKNTGKYFSKFAIYFATFLRWCEYLPLTVYYIRQYSYTHSHASTEKQLQTLASGPHCLQGQQSPVYHPPPSSRFFRVFVANELPASYSIERIPLLSKYSAVLPKLMEPTTQCRLYQNQVKIGAIVACWKSNLMEV